MKARLLIIICLLLSIPLQAQIGGKLLDAESQQPLMNVLVRNLNTGRWTLSDRNGVFEISVKSFPVKLQYHLLGKVDQTHSYTKAQQQVRILLKDDNLSIDEVQVVAKRKKQSTGSNLVLQKQAIELVQAQSVADVMQLIPGKPLSESDLHERQLLTLRSAIFNETTKFNKNQGLGYSNNEYLLNNSFGVGYLVDDMPLNNNVNMTGGRGVTLKSGVFTNLEENSSVGVGVDLKNLSLENIESIEVVQGISSARYGDHNTGLIKIKKAHGYTPLRVNANLRGGSYGINLTQGFELKNNQGFLNFGVDYLNSNSDPRSVLSAFERINTSLSWSYRRKKKFENRLTVQYGQNINSYNTLENAITNRTKGFDNKSIRISNASTWFTNASWLDKLEVSSLLSYGKNVSQSISEKNTGGTPIVNSLDEGTFELSYTPVSFFASEVIENKPFSFFNRIELSKSFETASARYAFNLGTNLGIDKNFGRGNYSENDLKLLSTPDRVGYRNVNFNSLVPADVKFSSYVTSKISTKLFGKIWVTDLGLRYDLYNGISMLSPRLNTKLSLSRKLKARFGAGLFAKSPSLQSLFPGNLYYDFVIADFRTNNYSFALGHTFVRKYETPNIKPSKTLKFETGLDYTTKSYSASLTGYFNKQYDGFTNQRYFEIAQLPEFSYTFHPDRAPDYVQIGTTPTLLDYRRATNSLEATNYGLEVLLAIRKIRSINTSFNINAAYRYTQTFSDLPGYTKSKDSSSEPFIGLLRPVPQTYKTFNSTITATHHVPSIGLVITLTAEQFFNADSSIPERDRYAYAYYDRNMQYHNIPEQDRGLDKYIPIRSTNNNLSASSSRLETFYGNYHLRVAKEFESGLRFSFYAINFLNHRPILERINSDGELTYSELNRPISFGGSVSYKF